MLIKNLLLITAVCSFSLGLYAQDILEQIAEAKPGTQQVVYNTNSPLDLYKEHNQQDIDLIIAQFETAVNLSQKIIEIQARVEFGDKYIPEMYDSYFSKLEAMKKRYGHLIEKFTTLRRTQTALFTEAVSQYNLRLKKSTDYVQTEIACLMYKLHSLNVEKKTS